MKVDGCRRRGRPKKIWMDSVRNDMCVKSANTEITVDRVQWKMKRVSTLPRSDKGFARD